jgi:hypothetical protein
MKNQKSFLILFVLVSLFLTQGCKEDLGEIENSVLSFDPSFRKVLNQRDRLQEDLSSNKAAYFKEIESIEGQMGILKERKIKAKLEHKDRDEEIKRQIQPEARRLKQEVLDKKREYKRKKNILDEVNRDIKDVSGLIDKKDTLVLTSEEVESWNKRLFTLDERKKEVEEEIVQLQRDIEISGLKLKVLVLK